MIIFWCFIGAVFAFLYLIIGIALADDYHTKKRTTSKKLKIIFFWPIYLGAMLSGTNLW